MFSKLWRKAAKIPRLYSSSHHRPFSQKPSQSEQETIIKLLYNIGSRLEVEQYLSHFSSVSSHQFAVIKIGGQVLTDHLDTVASALTFLSKVGLYPIVVHGAGPQLNNLLKEERIHSEYIDGYINTNHINRDQSNMSKDA